MALMYDMDTVANAMLEAAAYYKPGKKSSKKVAKVLERFAAMRPVEVVEIPSASWELVPGKNNMGYCRCSRCGENVKVMMNYCAECGARMDGGMKNG